MAKGLLFRATRDPGFESCVRQKSLRLIFKRLSNCISIKSKAYCNIALCVSISYSRVGSQKPLISLYIFFYFP